MAPPNVNPENGAIIIDLAPETKAWLEDLIRDNVALLALAMKPIAANAKTDAGMFGNVPPASTGGQRSNVPAGSLPTTFPNYGRSKGKDIFGASDGDLSYYAEGARKSIADPAKARWVEKERALLAAIDNEIARQGKGSTGAASVQDYGQTNRSPGPTNDNPDDPDVPFAVIETRLNHP